MRIIAGEFRGRKLLPPPGDATRPVTDRVKQSLFDILTPLLDGARVYDCFSGTGSMGLECLSRGAAHATFFDADRGALAALKTNISTLHVEPRSTVIAGDLFKHLSNPQSPIPNPQSEDPSFSKLPNLILIDGGKGQLNAACAELAKLKLSHIPIIGLAKEFEEIYLPGQPDPIRLDHNTGALKLLQRVRDESHRFANTYNAQLRLKRISESILDEFPGIGQRRKAALLKKFGSLQRLRLATLEQIAEVPGFGGKAAQELKTFLDARSNITRPASDLDAHSAEPSGLGNAEPISQ
jgi:hypothetical protein